MLIETPIRLQKTGNAQEPGAALFVFQQTLLLRVIPHGSLATTPGQAPYKEPYKILRWGKKTQQGELWRLQLNSGELSLTCRGLWWANTPWRYSRWGLNSKTHPINGKQSCVTPAAHTPSQLRTAWPQNSPKVPGRAMPGHWAHAMWYRAKDLLKFHEMTMDLCWSCAALSNDEAFLCFLPKERAKARELRILVLLLFTSIY